MRHPLRSTALAGATLLAVVATQTTTAAPTAETVYTVNPNSVPGVATGLVLRKGRSITVTATGSVCPGSGWSCSGPDGVDVDTWEGFLVPEAAAHSLVARVGSGAWMHVGAGPEQLQGSGELVFAFNDDIYGDNEGTFEVTVTYSRRAAAQVAAPCQPGWGYGDANHEHTGPPGLLEDRCRPGHGYGDENHDHSGPPGQAGRSDNDNGKSSDDHGKSSDDHGKSPR